MSVENTPAPAAPPAAPPATAAPVTAASPPAQPGAVNLFIGQQGTAAAPAPAAPAPPAAPATVTIPLEQLQAFTSIQARLAEHEERMRRESQETQRREAEALAQRGNLEDALRQLREQSEQQLAAERQKQLEIQQRAQHYALDSELSRALSAENLVPGGVEQLSRLFRGEFVVEPQGNAFQVRTPAYQSVPDFIKAQLARPEYAHFLRAHNPHGGTAGTQPTQAPPSSPANPAAPATPALTPHQQYALWSAANPMANDDQKLQALASLGLYGKKAPGLGGVFATPPPAAPAAAAPAIPGVAAITTPAPAAGPGPGGVMPSFGIRRTG